MVKLTNAVGQCQWIMGTTGMEYFGAAKKMTGKKRYCKTVKNAIEGWEFIGQKIVAIHPFTSDPVKQWPLERFKELGQRIKVELGFRVVMVGLIGAKNNEIASAAYGNLAMTEVGCSRNDGVDDGIVNMVNKTSLVELAALLKRCALLVSGDSGPVHLAAAVGVPVVALFRNDLAGKTAKRWGPWGEGHVVIERGNLEDISVDEVIETVKLKIG